MTRYVWLGGLAVTRHPGTNLLAGKTWHRENLLLSVRPRIAGLESSGCQFTGRRVGVLEGCS